MTSDSEPAPGNPFDTSVAHQARMYDYVLGGKDNYAADRAAVEAGLAAWPDMAFAMRANRAFLGRAVRYLAGTAGVRQFLDIGTGIPTAGNVHEVAQAVAPATRVLYADYDPVVLAHARALLDSHEAGATEYIDSDLRDTDRILARAAEVLDLSEPVAVTLVAILHVIPDSDDPHAIVAKIMGAVPSGSYLAISHAGADLFDDEVNDSFSGVMQRQMQQNYVPRGRGEVARFLGGLELVDPGLVAVENWRPEPGPRAEGRSSIYGAVARKP